MVKKDRRVSLWSQIEASSVAQGSCSARGEGVLTRVPVRTLSAHDHGERAAIPLFAANAPKPAWKDGGAVAVCRPSGWGWGSLCAF